jgi:hypothetical protein
MTDHQAPLSDGFIAGLVTAAADLALTLVGVPDEEMLASLFDTRENLKADLTDQLGADAAKIAAEAFVATVARCKREMEIVAGLQNYGSTLN